ncbi:N-acetylmannosamine-6-phosphate 2-epimerase [Vagococcus zengguangii]|uniref:Putative N-acetylmannosamine-6-phosphate 2-epimerase n=1 Tax=Vagococcus zengguangii TaxID=2571750 RepID=A0A4D7CV57_9ENTE|nr:N-acetylmannosamine-6-phosphate 2-epimerase [Vagococcus zengguangii]QCI87244.1 N-acetylmannosamine-6-phosphate 2-epimerase [Vagococcus zengguangii]TLG80748.1 N-acetylmannosamine-6-phosphate 2-epimerase [Vagococcus zengguangii]
MESDVLKKIKGGLIVSCQALKEEPLHSSFIMSRMAKAAVMSGAIGIRANSVVDIQAIKDTVSVPVIGILKNVYEGCSIFITPTLKEVRRICATGAEIVAMDATTRSRPNGEQLPEIIKVIREEYPTTLLMADCATLEDVEYALSLGFDIIGTTLYGYTEDTQGCDISDDDFKHLKDVLEMVDRPVIAEGKIDTPEKAKRVLELGCWSVVTGGAITRPQEIAKKFVDAINN